MNEPTTKEEALRLLDQLQSKFNISKKDINESFNKNIEDSNNKTHITKIRLITIDEAVLKIIIPWNKDKKGIHLSPKTEFKKGNIPPFKNKKIPYEIYEHRCKKVLCIETGEIFKSVNEAQRIKKCRNISQVCKGVRKTSLGYHWRYYEE
jgi:hypothetical protein